MFRWLLLLVTLPLFAALKEEPPLQKLEALTGTPCIEWFQPGDRWTFKDRFEGERETILPLMKNLGMFAAKHGKRDHYDYGVVLGSLRSTVEKRIGHLIDEWNRGVRFDTVVFLTGQRPLQPKEILDVSLQTETEMMVDVWGYMEMPEELRALPLVVVDAPPLTGRDRPTTACTVDSWLAMTPEEGTLLAFSSQPYVGYQQAVLRALLPETFEVETVGAAGGESLPISILLDTLSKQMTWEEKTLKE